MVKRYLGYLDSRHNVEPALQLTLDEERALLVALPAWQLSAVLHQRAAALGISLPEVPAAAAATAAADPGRTTAPCSRSVMAILYSAKMAAYWGSEPFVTPYVPDEASAAASYGRIIVQLSGWPARRLETRLQQLGVTEGVACLRGRLAMARLPADSDAAALRNLLCNLLTHPQRLTELPAYLESQSFEPLPEAWFADAALPMRPMPAPQAPRVATPQILDEARPPAPPLPSGANLLAWTGSTQPPLWQHPKIGAAAQPAALPELPWSAPADADPVLREQMTALQAGLLRAAPQAFDMTGLAQPFDASARRQLLHAAVQQSARLQTSPGAVEALANVRTAHLTAHQRLRLEAGLDQRITLEHIVAALARDHMAALRSHNAALSDATLSALRQQAIAHLVAATQAQLMRRVQTLLASPEAEDSLRRKLGAAIASRRCYDPQRHPALLAFEYRNDLLLRRDQVVALHTLLQNIDASGAADRGCILQLPMGAGKTKVLLPLLAHYAAGPQRLPVVVVPPALLAVNHSDLARTSMRTFGQRCARFDFARGDPHDLERLEILHRNLALLMRQRGYLITTAAAIQSLNLAYQGALDDGDSRRVTALAQLVTRFADQGVAFIDEADQALDVRNEVVFGVGHTQPLPMGMRAAMVHLYTCMLEDPALVARIDLVNDRQATLTPEIYATEVAPRLRDAYVEHSAQVHGGGLRAAYARSPQLRALLADTDHVGAGSGGRPCPGPGRGARVPRFGPPVAAHHPAQLPAAQQRPTLRPAGCALAARRGRALPPGAAQAWQRVWLPLRGVLLHPAERRTSAHPPHGGAHGRGPDAAANQGAPADGFGGQPHRPNRGRRKLARPARRHPVRGPAGERRSPSYRVGGAACGPSQRPCGAAPALGGQRGAVCHWQLRRAGRERCLRSHRRLPRPSRLHRHPVEPANLRPGLPNE